MLAPQRATVRGQRTAPKPAPVHPTLAKLHADITASLRTVFVKMKDVEPRNATPEDIATVLEALVTAKIAQVDIAKRLNTTKASVNRYRTLQSPPRPVSRPWLFEETRAMLRQELTARKAI